MINILTTKKLLSRDELFFKLKESILVSDNGCHNFTKYKDRQGYGKICFNYKKYFAHRLMWELVFGEIPDDMCICHKCDNPSCLNIDHLFIGTVRDNNLDKINKGRDHNKSKTHCKRGHPLSGDNLYVIKSRIGRECKQCHRDNINLRNKTKRNQKNN